MSATTDWAQGHFILQQLAMSTIDKISRSLLQNVIKELVTITVSGLITDPTMFIQGTDIKWRWNDLTKDMQLCLHRER
jgi:hypothetical protein